MDLEQEFDRALSEFEEEFGLGPQVSSALSCCVQVPVSLATQQLAGVIFAEATATRTSNDERQAVGWVFQNRVDHVNGTCARDARWFSGGSSPATILDTIRTGSGAYGGRRWNLVMSGDALRTRSELCALTGGDLTHLCQSILAAETVMSGGGRSNDIAFNRATNRPPSPRMRRSRRVGSHTFYEFIPGRECR